MLFGFLNKPKQGYVLRANIFSFSNQVIIKTMANFFTVIIEKSYNEFFMPCWRLKKTLCIKKRMYFFFTVYPNLGNLIKWDWKFKHLS